MKSYKVKRPYTDRETGEQRSPGDVVQATDKRAAQLRDADVIYREVVTEPAADTRTEPEGGEDEHAESGKRTRRKPADASADSDG